MFIRYLRSSATGRSFLQKHQLSNWKIYKYDLFNEFHERLYNSSPTTVGAIDFRGDIINDKPFVVETIRFGDDDTHDEQSYFMNLSGFMSVLYASIRTDASDKQGRLGLLA